MKGDRIHFSSASGEWGTPLELYHKLDAEFHFTLDPCTTSDNPLGTKFYYTKMEDGLKRGWLDERVFCNPPYGKGIGTWLEKGLDSEVAVFLLPVRTDTRWFHERIWNKHTGKFYPGVKVRFISGRLTFRGAQWSAPFPSMIVIFE